MKTLNSLRPRFQGPEGKRALFQTTSTHLQWKIEGDSSWQNLVSLDSLAPNKMPTTGGIFTGNIQVKNILETKTEASVVDGVVTLDLSQGGVFYLYLADHVSNINITNIPTGNAVSFTLVIKQNSDSSKTLNWSSNIPIYWPYNESPIVTNALDKTDFYSFLSIDAGVTFFGFSGGQAYN
jgi:hypothetical protein